MILWFFRSEASKPLDWFMRRFLNRTICYSTCGDCGAICDIKIKQPFDTFSSFEEYIESPEIIIYKRKINE
jgi:hypothetical protein